jgi:hypothetical protein
MSTILFTHEIILMMCRDQEPELELTSMLHMQTDARYTATSAVDVTDFIF